MNLRFLSYLFIFVFFPEIIFAQVREGWTANIAELNANWHPAGLQYDFVNHRVYARALETESSLDRRVTVFDSAGQSQVVYSSVNAPFIIMDVSVCPQGGMYRSQVHDSAGFNVVQFRRYADNGQVLWEISHACRTVYQSTVFTSANDSVVFADVEVDNSGNMLINVWLMNSSGSLLWTGIYDTPFSASTSNPAIRNVFFHLDGTIGLAGDFYEFFINTDPLYDFYVRFDNQGILYQELKFTKWLRDGYNDWYVMQPSVFYNETNNQIIFYNNAEPDHQLLVYDTTGNFVTSATFTETLNRIIQLRDQGYALCGNDAGRGVLLRLDESGQLLWKTRIDSCDNVNDACENQDGTFFYCGNGAAFFTGALEASGNEQWSRQWNDHGLAVFGAQGNYIARGDDGAFYVSGYVDLPTHFPRGHVAILKYILTTTGIAMNTNPDIQLLIYPQPATNELNILLPDEMNNTCLTWKFYSISGALISTGKSIQGNQLTIALNTFKSGIYFLEIEAGHKIFRKRVEVMERE